MAASETFKRTTTTKRTVKGIFIGDGQIEIEVDKGVTEVKNIVDYFEEFTGCIGEFSITQKTEEDLTEEQ